MGLRSLVCQGPPWAAALAWSAASECADQLAVARKPRGQRLGLGMVWGTRPMSVGLSGTRSSDQSKSVFTWCLELRRTE